MEDAQPKKFKEKWVEYIRQLQNDICSALEEEDGKAKFITDEWQRLEGHGGGGITRVISGGDFLEKGGVNTSVVYGEVNEQMKAVLPAVNAHKWFAAGLSMVLHPVNPYVPTMHANWRYFELYDIEGRVVDRWFGGGTDLTPYYLFEEDVIHFHQTIKNAMDPFGEKLYPAYKKICDEYFVNKHRGNEMRGVGGVFYEHLRPKDAEHAERLLKFQMANGNAFTEGYLPIVQKRKNIPFGEKEIEWQEIRRGRYAEFNLVYDRGTLFGLKTNGRTESILMSLPPRARWEYDHEPSTGSEEAKLLEACRHPKNWLAVN